MLVVFDTTGGGGGPEALRATSAGVGRQQRHRGERGREPRPVPQRRRVRMRRDRRPALHYHQEAAHTSIGELKLMKARDKHLTYLNETRLY